VVTVEEAGGLLRGITRAWLSDPDSPVEWVGEYEGRWGMRMGQQAREATTIWFTLGEHTVGYEAYLLPQPPRRAADVYRLCLVRNHRSWPAAVSMDDRGDLYVRGRIPLTDFTAQRLGEAVGAVYETVELSFRPLVTMGFGPREKSP
jgi:hypothetical protein